jgi:hypothetical protein
MPTQNQGIPDVPTSTIITEAAYFETEAAYFEMNV